MNTYIPPCSLSLSHIRLEPFLASFISSLSLLFLYLLFVSSLLLFFLLKETYDGWMDGITKQNTQLFHHCGIHKKPFPSVLFRLLCSLPTHVARAVR